ncbi:hypothetical protein GQX74_001997 [Glossina fuscipes]|nr:hypothetical protein GQX74_001997 [Glossina fuscipes]
MDNCSRRCISCNIFSWALAALKSLPFSRASSSAAANSKCNLARLSCCSRILVICSIVQPEPALNKTPVCYTAPMAHVKHIRLSLKNDKGKH